MSTPRVLSCSIALFAIGCGSAAPTPKESPAVAKDRSRNLASERMHFDEPEESYEGSGVGGLSQEDYESAFASVQHRVEGCLVEGASRFEGLGGHLKVVLRVDAHGEPMWAYLGETALGDRETEKCVLDVFLDHSWPRPKGGDGLAERTFSMEPAEPPATLTRSELGAAAVHARNLAARCKNGVGGRFRATAYVDAKGRVITAGVAPPDEKGEEVADCVVDAIKKVKVVRRNKRAAKVSFNL